MQKYWFIEEGFFAEYQSAVALGYKPEVKAEKLDEIRGNADKWAGSGYANNNLNVVGGEAHISIKGVLLESASVIDELYAKYFGETYSTYGGIQAQIVAAEQNSFVNKIIFDVDSPGGVMAGVDNAAMQIATSTKPTEARVGWMAASAAYYLASQADSIVASNPTSSVGSIGVVVDLVDASEAYKKWGVKRYSITSTNAPKKRPEPHSEEFVAQVTERLDELHNIFASRVAEGRTRATGDKLSVEKVNETFGQGGMVIAAAAKEIGMIDSISDMSSNPKEVGMTEQEKADVQVQIDSAKDEGVNQERARVAALLPWMAADSEGVMTAIESGEAVSQTLIAGFSTKMAEKAKADAEAQVVADDSARVAQAAAKVEADKTPEVSGVVTEDERSEDEKVQDELLAGMKTSKNGDK